MSEDQDHTTELAEAIRTQPGLPSRYEIKALVGSGGMGTVYRALDQILERDVAIKVLWSNITQDDKLSERFLQEAKILASLDHPNIVKLLTWGLSSSGSPYLVMELLDGQALSAEIGNGERLTPTRFYQIFSQALS